MQQRIASIARQVAAIAAIVVALIPQVPLPGPWSRVALVIVGGVLQIAEHIVADPSTGNSTASSPTTTTKSAPSDPPLVRPTDPTA